MSTHSAQEDDPEFGNNELRPLYYFPLYYFHYFPRPLYYFQEFTPQGGFVLRVGQKLPVLVWENPALVAKVVKTDIETSNGVIHVIDSVILPADKDIVDTAVGAGSFKTLVAAVKAAGLVDTLKSKGPFTVFAPTDEAFAKLPEGTVANLLKPENKDQLVAILTYHVVVGKVMASDVVKISFAKTVNGKSAAVKVSDAGVMVDNAKVVATDIETSNGVIHVIDSVILP